jgi:hypothetical protein
VRRLEGTARAIEIHDALVADIEAGGAKDALPLLAFTLERLYGDYHAGGHLKLEHYEQLGRIKGSIEAAVERAFKSADADARIPKDRPARLALLRRGLIPWLAGIDPYTGAVRRRVARMSEIPPEALSLVNRLVEQRLLSTDKDTGETTIEPAHEALLREWRDLNEALGEEREFRSAITTGLIDAPEKPLAARHALAVQRHRLHLAPSAPGWYQHPSPSSETDSERPSKLSGCGQRALAAAIQKQTFVGLASTTLSAQPIMSALEGVPVRLMVPRAGTV